MSIIHFFLRNSYEVKKGQKTGKNVMVGRTAAATGTVKFAQKSIADAVVVGVRRAGANTQKNRAEVGWEKRIIGSRIYEVTCSLPVRIFGKYG
jgi:hypothetical protein